MIFRTTTIPKKEDFFRKRCQLGLDDIAYMLEYGAKHEFIGTLSKANNLNDELFSIEVDECDTNGKITLARGLNANNLAEKSLILKALEYDYGFENIEIVTTARHSAYEIGK